MNTRTRNKTVIVTGATGFIGRHIVARLVSEGFEVIAFVRDVEKARQIKGLENVQLVTFDIVRPELLPKISTESTMIHCAWQNVRDTLSLKHIENYYHQHYCFLKAMIERGVAKLIVLGSCYEYGNQYGPISATATTVPTTPYALAKDMLHKSLRLLQKNLKFELTWVRLFYLYGEGQDPECIIPMLDAALDNNEQAFNMSLGEQLFDYLPVEDVAKEMMCILDAGDGTFNLCSANPISLRRLLEERMRAKGKTIRLNLGSYPYRDQETMAIWGSDTISDQLKAKAFK